MFVHSYLSPRTGLGGCSFHGGAGGAFNDVALVLAEIRATTRAAPPSEVLMYGRAFGW